MKKIMFALIAAALLLTGCGQRNLGIDDGTGVETSPRYTEPIDNPAKPKRQPARTTATTETSTTVQTSASKNISSETQTDNTTDTKTNAVNATTQTETKTETVVPEETENIDITAPENTDIVATEVTTDVTTQTPTEVYYLDGIVYEVHDKYIVINETDLKRVQVSVADASKIEGINVGDTVEITYDGLINEGSVNYAYDAYSVEVTKKADKEYSFEHYEYNGVSFSLLVPEGWNSKIIDYPQEGEFTDWGVRFAPDGAVGSMDITWHSSISISGGFDKTTTTMKEMSVKKYSRNGVWRFFVFENNYVVTNNFFETSQHDQYANDMEIMLNTLEFN